MQKSGVVLMLFVLPFLVCRERSAVIVHEKVDAQLRIRIAEGGTEEIPFFIECNRPISDELRVKIENIGIVLESLAENLATARGKPKQIALLAEQDFVVRLQATRRVKLLDQE
jgi:hypothetical protein